MIYKYLKNKNNILIVVGILIILIIIIFIFFYSKNNKVEKTGINLENFKGQIINDVIKIPETVTVSDNAGQFVPRGEYEIKVQPQTEKEMVLIVKAKLTIKEAYQLAVSQLENNWSKDALLVFIKSNGALGLDGKSSSWQLIFSSVTKNKSYEVIITEDKIINTKELNDFITGYHLPTNWYDSYEAIASLSNLPQFKEETISALSFYYDNLEKSWAYGLANGEQTTSMWVK